MVLCAEQNCGATGGFTSSIISSRPTYKMVPATPSRESNGTVGDSRASPDLKQGSKSGHSHCCKEGVYNFRRVHSYKQNYGHMKL